MHNLKPILITIFTLLTLSANASEYRWKVIEVVDGDTLRVETPFLPKELKLTVRVDNIDTPEKGARAKCDREAKLGETATKLTKTLIANSQEIAFYNIKWDKFGGRILAEVELDGANLSSSLIKAGVAREYHGEKKKSWCK
jgi:endonuclease YncB( thermonuclease family)